MDNKCLSFEDMSELLSTVEISDKNRSRLFQINKHLIHCKSCGENYRKLAKLYDTIEGWSVDSQYEAEQKLQHMKTCLALMRAQKETSPKLVKRIDNWLKNYVDSSAKIVIDISDGIKMAVDEACTFVSDAIQMNFGFANLAAARGEPAKTDAGLLIDKNNASNRIKIEGQRTVSISLADVSGIAPLVAVIPRDDVSPAIVAELLYDEQQKCWLAEIENLRDGEYDLVIEAQEEE